MRQPIATSNRGRPAQRATALAIGVMFFVNGASLASWFPRLPEIRERLGVSDAQLGLTLLGAGLGGLTVSIFSGALVDRFGSRRVCVTTSVVLAALLPLVGFAGRPLMLFALLIAMGAFDGLTDVAMNSQAVVAQRARSRPIMSRFHGMWSVGAVSGGLLCAKAGAAGVSLRTQLLVTAPVLVAATLATARWLIPPALRAGAAVTPSADGSDSIDASIIVVEGAFGDAGVVDGHVPTSPSRPIRDHRRVFVRLFLLGTAVALTEVPANDWASLMWTDRFDLAEGRAALGFVAVASGMVVGRFTGDLVTHRFGAERTRRGGALLAVAGVLLATLAPAAWPLSGLGLFAAGLGASSLFPLMFGASEEMTPGTSHGMAAFSSGARLGILSSAPLVGALATVSSIATAIVIITGLAGLAVAVTRLRGATTTDR